MVEVLDDRGVLLSLGIGRKNLLIAQLISVPVTHVNVRSGDCSTSYQPGDMLWGRGKEMVKLVMEIFHQTIHCFKRSQKLSLLIKILNNYFWVLILAVMFATGLRVKWEATDSPSVLQSVPAVWPDVTFHLRVSGGGNPPLRSGLSRGGFQFFREIFIWLPQ